VSPSLAEEVIFTKEANLSLTDGLCLLIEPVCETGHLSQEEIQGRLKGRREIGQRTEASMLTSELQTIHRQFMQ
jgi:hypothetical protein